MGSEPWCLSGLAIYYVNDPAKINLLDLDRSAMEAFFESLGAKAFHGRNVLKWIHKHGVTEFDEMTDLSKKLRARLQQEAVIEIPQMVVEQPSSDGTVKWVLQLGDGQRIETVYIPDGNRSTVCVSSQVGCALGCLFCLTGRGGFRRDLRVDEIVDQVLIGRSLLPPERMINNVVLMGMGEALLNLQNVIPALQLITAPQGIGISNRRVTVSTCATHQQIKILDYYRCYSRSLALPELRLLFRNIPALNTLPTSVI